MKYLIVELPNDLIKQAYIEDVLKKEQIESEEFNYDPRNEIFELKRDVKFYREELQDLRAEIWG